jgi:hypothetical protein
MLTFSFSVGSADDARTAAEVCDFLAERMAPGAVPAKRTRSSSKTAEPVQLPNDNPTVVSDPAALYAALSGTPVAESLPAVESSPAQVDPPARDERLAKARELIKQRGGLWFGNYMKSAGIDKKLSDYTDDELIAIHNAAVLAA